jgi:polyphosphate glucokinase
VKTKRTAGSPRKVLVVDIGGSHVKCVSSDHSRRVRFKSNSNLTPRQMVRGVRRVTRGWQYDAVSIGYPGVVRRGRIVAEPHNLGSGWPGFDLQSAFGCPVRLLNDAAMQALGGYEGGKMLFLGLGTGLGSALIVDGVIATMELGHLHYSNGHSYEHYLGKKGRKRLGNKKWSRMVTEVVSDFRNALLPDCVMLGGGNAEHLHVLPPLTRRCDNANAFRGGFRLWEPRGSQTTSAVLTEWTIADEAAG